MPIPDRIIDEIHDKTDIVEVISRYVPLKKVGRNYKAPCPFHHEKTPSFIVSPDKQIYHCFGCGAGGNVFSFLMKYENMQFPEAVEMLAPKAGVMLPKAAFRSKEENSFAERLYGINELACQFFIHSLSQSKAAGDYLALRGIGDEILKRFMIGYAPESWDSLINFFKSKGVTADLLEKAGLAVSNDKGGYYDRFRARIIFPISDIKGRVLGFGGRVLDSSLPKYINSPETIIYSKGKNLYGLNASRDLIKKEGHALIVEGYLDFLIPYQAGLNNIVATLGTALTVDQVKLLKRLANTVVMVYDPDEAGEAASIRNLDLFISEDMNVYIAELPPGLDPDSYIRKYGAEDFRKLVKSSKNIFEYKYAKLSKEFDARTAHGKANIAAGMLSTISRINNAVFRSDLVKKLAARLGVDEDSIRQELKKVKPDYEKAFFRPGLEDQAAKTGPGNAEMILLALLLSGGEFINRIAGRVSPEEFRSTSIREIVNSVFSLHKDNLAVTPAKLINHLGNGSEASAIIPEAISILETITDNDKALDECVTRLKRDNIKDRLGRIQDAIRAAHGHKDEVRVKELMAEYGELVKVDKVLGRPEDSREIKR